MDNNTKEWLEMFMDKFAEKMVDRTIPQTKKEPATNKKACIMAIESAVGDRWIVDEDDGGDELNFTLKLSRILSGISTVKQ